MTVRVEELFVNAHASVVRLRGVPVEPLDGVPREVVAYVGPEVTTVRLVETLREVADMLERSIGRGQPWVDDG